MTARQLQTHQTHPTGLHKAWGGKKRQRWSDYYAHSVDQTIWNIWIRDSRRYLQKPVAVTAPRLPVQDMFSLCRRVQRLCRWHREASVSRAQYGCRLSWMYCSGSQQCLWKSLQLWANRHRSGTGRWLTISWINCSDKNKQWPEHSMPNILVVSLVKTGLLRLLWRRLWRLWLCFWYVHCWKDWTIAWVWSWISVNR